MTDVWRFAPLVPFSETLSFLTDIQRAELAESRTSVRHARSVYPMTHRLNNAANLEAEGVFDDNRAGPFRVPAWGEATQFAMPYPPGATVLPVGPADWRAGGEVFLASPGGAVEVIGISAVGSGTITLDSATTLSVLWAAPLRQCEAITPLAGSRMFDGLSDRRATFVTQDNTDLGAHDMPTVDGLMVIDDAPVSARGTEQAMVHPVQVIDEGPGGVVIVPLRDGVDHRLSISFTDVGLAALWRRRQFWHALRGRATEFWLPSFVRDLALRGDVAAASLTLRLVAPVWSPDLLTGRVLTLADGGARVHRKVTAVTVDGADWVCDLSAAPGRLIWSGARVSIARRMRLDTDDITLTFPMPGMMVSGAACVGVP